MAELHTDVPDDALAREIVALTTTVEHEDGAPPLSDQALSRLHSHAVAHAVLVDGARVVGYAQREDGGVEVVAQHAAVAATLDSVAGGGLLVWSHGQRSRLVDEFEQRGWLRVRELFQLRRPLDDLAADAGTDPPLADGVTVRTFVPGTDDAEWLAVNAAAFAHHPEQGRMTQADLDARMAEPWFDASGFLLAHRDGRLVAFHWTKVHPGGLGEVYVLGVAPDAQGLGLGGALLARGLRLLHDAGCRTALLYVDGDNPTAVHLYERDGFARYDLDVQWRMADSPPLP